jgi:hypothetical protein
MRSLHDAILYEETHRIKEKDESYMVLVVKVPKGLGFVEASYTDKYYLRYSDIFDMYQTYRLHYTLVRLYSLNMAVRVIRDNTPGIAIVDPFFMRENCLDQPGDQAIVVKYLKDFMLNNKKKDYILMPYHPDPT